MGKIWAQIWAWRLLPSLAADPVGTAPRRVDKGPGLPHAHLTCFYDGAIHYLIVDPLVATGSAHTSVRYIRYDTYVYDTYDTDLGGSRRVVGWRHMVGGTWHRYGDGVVGIRVSMGQPRGTDGHPPD